MERYKFFFTKLALFGLIVLILPAIVQNSHDAMAAANQKATLGNKGLVQKDIDPSSAMFIENVGQFDDGARFKVYAGDYTIWLANDAIWVTLLEPSGTHSEFDHSIPLGTDRFSQNPSDFNSHSRQGVNVRISFTGANLSSDRLWYKSG